MTERDKWITRIVIGDLGVINEIEPEKIDRELVREFFKSGGHLKDISEDRRTKNVCLEAFMGDCENPLAAFPAEMLNEEFFMKAVCEVPQTLGRVPLEFRTDRVCLTAVSYGISDELRHVPKEHLSYGMCLAASCGNRKAFEYIPEDLRSQDIVIEYIRSGGSLDDVSVEKRTEDVCIEALRYNAAGVEEGIPPDTCTKKFCLRGIAVNPYETAYISESYFHDPSFCLQAVAMRGDLLRRVATELQSTEMCCAARLGENAPITSLCRREDWPEIEEISQKIRAEIGERLLKQGDVLRGFCEETLRGLKRGFEHGECFMVKDGDGNFAVRHRDVDENDDAVVLATVDDIVRRDRTGVQAADIYREVFDLRQVVERRYCAMVAMERFGEDILRQAAETGHEESPSM